LTAIGEDFYFRNNSSVTNLTGFENLTSVGGDFNIENNDSLINIVGLESLNYIGGSLWILYNYSLIDLTGMDSLISIAGILKLERNSSLINLTGLENLNSVSGHLLINRHDELISLMGLDNLTSVGGDIRFVYNTALVDIESLGNLDFINGEISFYYNPSLASLKGLENIDAGTITKLIIRENWELSTCEVQSICDYFALPDCDIDIVNNAPDCNSQSEVEEACISSVNEIGDLFRIEILPNPFFTFTTIEYELKQPSTVYFSVYNQMGQQVYRIHENQPSGKQQLLWNADHYPDGIYNYILQTGNQIVSGKVVKVK